MPEQRSEHPTEDELVELALGSTSHDSESTILKHVNGCLPCRSAYDEISRTLDETLAASPSVAPPAGFDARVLDSIGVRPSASPRRSRRLPLLVAAAAVAGIALGGAVGVAIERSDSPAASKSPVANELRTADGDGVGTVLRSRYDGQDVLVMQIEDGPPGMHYRCRFRLEDGSTQAAGEWTVPPEGDAVWIAPVPADPVARVELVTDSGSVWSEAQITS